MLSAALMIVVGCTSVTSGKAVGNGTEAPAYRTSMSASVSASAASSSERESKRMDSLTTQAVHNSCDALSSSSVNAVTAVNAFVSAVNSGGDAGAKEGPAIDALNKSADLVSSSLTDVLSTQLRDGLTAYVNASRAVGDAIKRHAPSQEFNDQVNKLNGASSDAMNLCDAAY